MKNRSLRRFITFCLTLTLLTGIWSIQPQYTYADTAPAVETSIEVKKEAAALIKEHYGITFTEEELASKTLPELVSILNDPFSRHISASEWQQMNQWYEDDELAHVGITFAKSDGEYRVLKIDVNSPLYKAGIKPGDVIVSVDGKPAKTQTKQEIFSSLFGKKGSTVKISFSRGKDKMTKTVKRAVLPIAAVESQMLDKHTGYIRIYTFMDQMVFEQFQAQWEALRQQGMRSVVLDLRFNGGGLMEETRQVASLLRDKGVFTYYKSPAGLMSTYTLDTGKKPDYTMTVLVNEYTASSAEALSGFLKDYKLATIVGTQTYGKGVMQMPYPLSDGSYLMLTTQEFFSPGMNKIQKQGITPDKITPAEKNELNRLLDKSGLTKV